MTLVLNLPPDVEARLATRAKAGGKDISTYVNDLIRNDLERSPTFAEILAPIHAASRLAEASDDALNQFTNDLINQTRRERRSHKGEQ